MLNKTILTIVLLSFGYIANYFDTAPTSNLLEEASIQYRNDLNETNQHIAQLVEKSIAFQNGEIVLDTLQNQLLETRNSYKHVELFMEYFQREAVAKYINGAPLPKLYTSAPGINVIDPNGLQTLDELIFSDNPAESAEEITQLSKKLKSFWNNLYVIEKSKLFQHRFILEACRFQIWRIYSLGLTGFDTPGSVNAIDEAKHSLESMKTYLKLYKPFAASLNATPIYDKVVATLNDFISYLEQNDDFDSLDRMEVLRNYVNPLYKGVYELHKALKVEFVEEVDPTARAVNYHADYPFSDDFLYKGYFAEITDEELSHPKKIELGKILFYDPVLSKDLSMSCATCHHPDKAFTDGLPKSDTNRKGISTQRNAPTLVNSVYAERYFYDLREYSLERQVKHVVYDSKEFNMDFIELADRLKQSEEYLGLFDEVYGDMDKYGISSWSISNALAAYVASLSSWNSDFDKYARGETNQIDEAVIRGYNLFMGKAACGTCHFAPTFNGTIPPNYLESESEVLGVPAEPDTVNASIDPDPGRISSGRAIDEAEHFLFAFKTTTVRNAELTAPYMHNGVYEELDQVLDFYNRGGGAGIGIELDNQTLPDVPLKLNENEMGDLKTFIHSLTDTSGMTSRPDKLPSFGIADYDKRNIDY